MILVIWQLTETLREFTTAGFCIYTTDSGDSTGRTNGITHMFFGLCGSCVWGSTSYCHLRGVIDKFAELLYY